MISDITYREACPADAENLFVLIRDCFDEFVAIDYEVKGINEFYRHINTAELTGRILKGYYTLIAIYQEKMISMIQLKGWSHISLFFTRSEWQGKGLGRELLNRAIEKCKESNARIKSITVNASPFSVDIYIKLGFKRNRFEQNMNGIRYTPMELVL